MTEIFMRKKRWREVRRYITIKMATNVHGALLGPTEKPSLPLEEIGLFFRSHLFPQLHFHIFKLFPRSAIEVKTQHNLDTKCSVKMTSYPPHDINKESLSLFETLREWGITKETVKYEPKETRKETDKTIYCKNLFLKDRKGSFFYVICHEDDKVNLKSLKQELKAYRNFSFASEDEVFSILGVRAGEITPLALLRNTTKPIRIAVTKSVCYKDQLNFHPLDKRYATRISFSDLQKFLTNTGHTLELLDL